MILDLYIEKLHKILDDIGSRSAAAIGVAGKMVADSIRNSGVVHTFGTGHSHMIAEEAFFRAGGLVPVNAILDERLAFFDGALESTYAEREEGYALNLLAKEAIAPGDVAILISNSGRNAVPIEMALEMKRRDVGTIAITNLRQSAASPSRHASGRRLFEVVDLAIDTCVERGDAVVELKGVSQRMGPASTIAGAAIVNAIMMEAALIAVKDGHQPSIFPSANLTETTDDMIVALYRPFSGRIRRMGQL